MFWIANCVALFSANSEERAFWNTTAVRQIVGGPRRQPAYDETDDRKEEEGQDEGGT